MHRGQTDGKGQREGVRCVPAGKMLVGLRQDRGQETDRTIA
jgi:hypothetical protein